MFKSLTFVFGIVSKHHLQTLTKTNYQRPRERQGQLRFYFKSKRAKKMLRTWEFTQDARDFQQRQHEIKPQSKTESQQYRLISYNILAQDLLVEHIYLYQGINPQYLQWNHRLRCLHNELTNLDPDIMCIQEMQFNHLKEFVCRLSEKRKLEYIFKKKTGQRTDGCAIIYDKEKFKLIAEQGIEFFKPSAHNLNRENVALLARFQLRHEPDKQIVVGTTHLLFNPNRHDVRCAQVDLLLENLIKFARKANDQSGSYYPVILTGDFNSTPNSPPFQRLTTPCEDEVDRTQSAENIIDLTDVHPTEIENETISCGPSLQMNPRMKFDAIDFGHSCASTYHERWITVDYILKSVNDNQDEFADPASDVKIRSIYKLPTIKNCERIGKIPNQYLGSDHYLQAIEFFVV